jgi:DNA (cytosine-5)-methyltransferase 3A
LGGKSGLYYLEDGKEFSKSNIRRLTPLETERLQTIPDNYTDIINETNRYKCIGNGWTVDVIAHILSFINGFEKTTERGQKI